MAHESTDGTNGVRSHRLEIIRRIASFVCDRFWTFGVWFATLLGLVTAFFAWHYEWPIVWYQLLFGALLALCSGWILGQAVAAFLVARRAVDEKEPQTPDKETESKLIATVKDPGVGTDKATESKPATLDTPEPPRPEQSILELATVGSQRANLAALENIHTIRDLAEASDEAREALSGHWGSAAIVDDAISTARDCVEHWARKHSQSREGE